MTRGRAAALVTAALLLPSLLPPTPAAEPSPPEPVAPAAPAPAEPPSPMAGRPLPAFELEDLEGRPVSPAAMPGSVVSVHFFAVWCEPCVQQLPEIEKAASRYGSRGYHAVLIAVGHREDPGRLREFVQKRGLALPVLYDSKGTVAALFDLKALPTHVVAGRDGRIRWSATTLPPGFLRDIGRFVDEKTP